MKTFLAKKFSKFYYNGIFLQMTGKLAHLVNQNNQDVNINANNNQNEDKKKTYDFSTNDEEEKKKNQEKEFKNRLEKSRGLRKLLNKKAKEKKELLRDYFFKFYRAGIISKFRNEKKRKSCIMRTPISLELLEKSSLNKGNKSLLYKEQKEKDELKEKTLKQMEKIFYNKARKNLMLLKKAFQTFYLRIKLDSVQNIIENDKGKKKKKKMRKKKNKTVHEKGDQNIINDEEVK